MLLVAVGVDGLAEVAAAVEEAHGHEGQGHVGGGLAVVAGEHAEAARVDGQRLLQAVLGAEVGHGAVELVAVVAREPVLAAVGHVGVEVGQDGLVLDHEVGVLEQRGPVARGRRTATGLRKLGQTRRSMRAKSERTSGCQDQYML